MHPRPDDGLTVNGEKVEGWMDAVTMSYPVDKPEVLKMVKASFPPSSEARHSSRDWRVGLPSRE